MGGEEEEEEEVEEVEEAAFSAHTRSQPSLAVDTRNGWCGCAATSVLILPYFFVLHIFVYFFKNAFFLVYFFDAGSKNKIACSTHLVAAVICFCLTTAL